MRFLSPEPATGQAEGRHGVMRRALTVAAAAIAVVLLGASASAGAASATATAATGKAHTGTSNRGHIRLFNVGATHSPELERLMRVHAAALKAAARTRSAALPSAASTVAGIDVASAQHPSAAAI